MDLLLVMKAMSVMRMKRARSPRVLRRSMRGVDSFRLCLALVSGEFLGGIGVGCRLLGVGLGGGVFLVCGIGLGLVGGCGAGERCGGAGSFGGGGLG